MPNYYKIYQNLCESRKNLDRIRTNNEYYENHHIIPKCLGGKDTDDNLVLLIPREHFFVHLLLYKHYKKIGGESLRKMSFALVSMKGDPTNQRNLKFSSRDYGVFKEAAMNMNLGRKVKDTSNYKGKKSNEHKENIRKARLRAGKHSEERKRNISIAMTGKIPKMNLMVTTCPKCDKKGQMPAMKRWHFDNCREVRDAQLA